MKILAFDSTAKIASVAVLDDERLLGLFNIDNGLTQSELLLPMAEELLASLKLSFSDIELFAVSVGPGSFTGVRIGVSLVKGLAFSKNTPCVAVSTLEALAENLSPIDAILVPAMDARRSQVYTAIFRSKDGKAERITEDMAIPISTLAKMLDGYSDEDIYVSGDGYTPTKLGLSKLGINTKETPALLIPENAYSVGRVAYRKYKAGDFVKDTELSPIYLRLPQAERERLEKENIEKKDI